jgi:hypothetical protein
LKNKRKKFNFLERSFKEREKKRFFTQAFSLVERQCLRKYNLNRELSEMYFYSVCRNVIVKRRDTQKRGSKQAGRADEIF